MFGAFLHKIYDYSVFIVPFDYEYTIFPEYFLMVL